MLRVIIISQVYVSHSLLSLLSLSLETLNYIRYIVISLCFFHLFTAERALIALFQPALDANLTKCVKAWHGCGRHFHLLNTNGAFQGFLNGTYLVTSSAFIHFWNLLCFCIFLLEILFTFKLRFYLFFVVVFLRLTRLLLIIGSLGFLSESLWLIHLLKSTLYLSLCLNTLLRLRSLRLCDRNLLNRKLRVSCHYHILRPTVRVHPVWILRIHSLRKRLWIAWQGSHLPLHISDLFILLGLFVSKWATTLSRVNESALEPCAVQVWVALSRLLWRFTLAGGSGMTTAWRIPFIILHRMLLLASSVLIPALLAERANLGFDLPLVTRDNLQGLINTGRKNDVVEFACGITALFLVFA